MRPEKTWFVAQGRGFDSRHLHQSCLRSACRHILAQTIAYATVSPHKATSAVPKWAAGPSFVTLCGETFSAWAAVDPRAAESTWDRVGWAQTFRSS